MKKSDFTFVHLSALCFILLALTRVQNLVSAQTSEASSVQYTTYSEAAPILQNFSELLPPALKGKTPNQQSLAWESWIKTADAQIRTRLVQGDEDTLVNFLLLGNSFTNQKRLLSEELKVFKSGGKVNSINSRIKDLAKALISPGSNERLVFARNLLIKQGVKVNLANLSEIENYFNKNLLRVLIEQENLTQELGTAQATGNTSVEFAERSKIYRQRGLSLDTSLRPNFGIEQTLKDLVQKGRLSAGEVRRVAIIGPGLDFTDKQDGYDFYPQQTLQPFAVTDALFKLGLSNPKEFALTTFDLSPRVNSHLFVAKRNADLGQSYVIQLPLDSMTQWHPTLLDYWRTFGSQIGTSVEPIKPPKALIGLQLRAVRIRDGILKQFKVADTNIVLQHPNLPDSEKFDLVIATNILVYYDNFFQSLALLNIEKLLRPAGFLLSNNALLEMPSTSMRSVGYTAVPYSTLATDGDFIVWYQRIVN